MLTWSLLAVGQADASWYLLPLAAAISLVYSASRYELSDVILWRSVRLFATIIGCMLAIFAVLWLLSFGI
jgi:hypothetical protein